MTRRNAALSMTALGAALLLAACSDPAHPPPPPVGRDLGADAALDGDIADGDVLADGEIPLVDGEVPVDGDTPPIDGEVPPMDGATDLDAAAFDASGFDGAAPDDAGPSDAGTALDQSFPDFGTPAPCFDDAGVYDACACAPPALACTGPGDPACAPGTACIDTGCGNTYCLPSGATCIDDRDCSTGAVCTAVSATTRVCARAAGAACVDSRDCPTGYACEAGSGGRACVNRRIPCTYDTGCPFGFTCHYEAGIEAFCERVYLPCTNADACAGRRCLDVDRDGRRECGYGGCTASSSCAAGLQCAFEPSRITMACGSHGVCHADTDCGTGETCIDVWGDGVQQCELAGSTCSAGTCPAGQLCGSVIAGGIAQCRATP